jgi:hypothetical protein
MVQPYWHAELHSGICIHRQYIEAIWKEVFEEVIFSSNIIKTPKSSRDGARKKESKKKRKKEKRKALKVSSNKGEANILRGERHFNFKNPFWCDLIFSSSIIPFQKPLPKSLRKFLDSFWTIL